MPPSARAPIRTRPQRSPLPLGRPGRLLTFPSPPPRVWPARRAAPGQGRGAGGRGAGLGGSGRVRAGGAGTVPKGGEGAAGCPRSRGRARPSRRRGGGRGPEEGRQGPGRRAGSSSLRDRPGSRARRGRETPTPGKPRTRRADRGRGTVLSPRLTNQSGPAEPGHCHRRCGARGSPAGPAPPAAGCLGSARAGVAGGAVVIRLRARAARAGAGAERRRIPASTPARRWPGPAARSPSPPLPRHCH